MKKALQTLFGKKTTDKPLVNSNFRSFSNDNTPSFRDWCCQLNVGILADKHSNNVPILMGTKIKYVDLHTIKN